jgi:hypothetical protein
MLRRRAASWKGLQRGHIRPHPSDKHSAAGGEKSPLTFERAKAVHRKGRIRFHG